VNNPRERISEALFALLQTANGTGPNQFSFPTFSRQARIWNQTALQPGSYLIKLGESVSDPDAYGAKMYVCHYSLLVYAEADPTATDNSESTINKIVDAIDYALQTKPQGQPQTIGALVIDAWIEGELEYNTGILTNQIGVSIPIKVRTGI
jgi:hypothetical protein